MLPSISAKLSQLTLSLIVVIDPETTANENLSLDLKLDL